MTNLVNRQKIGGALVGIGKQLETGEIIYHKLEKPIPNKITSVGLDGLMTFAGTTTDYSKVCGSYPSTYWLYMGGNSSGTYYATTPYTIQGPLRIMIWGDDDTPSSFNDTSLGHGLGATSTPVAPEGQYTDMQGSRSNCFGSYSHRVSHKTPTFSETKVIREIGYRGFASNVDNDWSKYYLFSRIVLDSPITINAGESLITTYQLDFNLGNTTIETIDNFGSVLDSNGNTLKAQMKLGFGARTSYNDNWGWQLSMNFLTVNYYNPEQLGIGDAGYWTAPWVGQGLTNTYYGGIGKYSTVSSYEFPAENAPNPSGLTSISTSNTYEFTVIPQPYACVGKTYKFRDKVFTLGLNCPGMSSPTAYKDIYFMRLDGLDFRFGYMENGTWVPQALRKYANQELKITIRTQFITDDTTPIPEGI